MESNYEKKLDTFVSFIVREKPQVIALQEIMQPIFAPQVNSDVTVCGKIPLKAGNHGLNIIERLKKYGEHYNYTWLGIKRSYDRFDEGVAFLTKEKPQETKDVLLTSFDEYDNWRTRKALGVKVNGEWYYSVHLGWWEDDSAPLEYQIKALVSNLNRAEPIWLMGDFNSIAEEKGKGYDLIKKMGFFDTYLLAKQRNGGITANTKIDGWNGEDKGIRIDYIFCSLKVKIKSSKTVFTGENESVISDHFGILTERN